MGGVEVSQEELLDHLEAMGVATPRGDTTSAYVDLDHPLNLSSVALGLELGELLRAAERFPGLVYETDDYEETVLVVFDDGTVFIVSAGSARVQDILEDVADRLLDLELLEGFGPDATFEPSPQTVPVPAYEVPEGAEIADGKGVVDTDSACRGCDHDLAGDENYCPECGLKLEGECPDCGHELAGNENYCPECGTAVADN